MELQIHDGQAEKVAFRSPRRMLVRFFRTSRDRWKQKYKTLKESFRKQVWQIRDLTRSREQWRREAEALQRENEVLQKQVAASAGQNPVEHPPALPRRKQRST